MTHTPTTHKPHNPSDRQSPPDGPRVELIIIRGRTRQRVRPVAGRVFLIGAAEDCDLALVDEQFAPVTGYLIRTAKQVQLRWLTADPELTINGQPREHATLNDQDRIRTGSYEFLVRVYPVEPGPGHARTVPAPHWSQPPFAGVVAATDSQTAEQTSHGTRGLSGHVSRVAATKLRLYDGRGRRGGALDEASDPDSSRHTDGGEADCAGR